MIDDLKSILGSESVSNSIAELEKFSVAGKTPSLVLFPRSIESISKIMALAHRDKKKVLITGNNSQHHFGAAIETPDWGISLTRMKRIIEHEAVDLIVTVEAGVTVTQLQRFLAASKQFLPLDPMNMNQRTLGGIVATNSSGSLKLRYGSCRDLVSGLKVVLADGTIIRTGGRTVKNVAGYDLTKLFIGSMGTLGVIAEITFKLSPNPSQNQTLWAKFEQFTGIPDVVSAIGSSNLVVSRCDYLNASFMKTLISEEYASNTLHHLLLTIQGHQEMVSVTVTRLQEMLSKNNCLKINLLSPVDEVRLWDQINSNDGKLPYAFHAQISIPKANFGQVINDLEQYMIENKLAIACHAHAGNGIIHLFWGNPNNEMNKVAVWKSQVESLRQIAQRYQGNMIVYRAAVPIRKPELIWGKPDQNFSLFKAIKSNYDIHQVLSTGRFIGGL